jgi:hypothetical protein
LMPNFVCHRFEFATTVRHFYGKNAYVVFQLVYNMSMQASNIAAMIISAQVSADLSFFVHL